MALRDYMQDLLRAQTSRCEHQESEDDNDSSVKITIVDDNSFSTIPDECITDFGNRSLPDDLSTSSSRLTKDNGEAEECRNKSNRIMLDRFRRRQRFLRETLSPKRIESSTNGTLPLHLSPSGHMHLSPYDSEQRMGDSQSDRMRQLKMSLRMQQNAPLPLA